LFELLDDYFLKYVRFLLYFLKKEKANTFSFFIQALSYVDQILFRLNVYIRYFDKPALLSIQRTCGILYHAGLF